MINTLLGKAQCLALVAQEGDERVAFAQTRLGVGPRSNMLHGHILPLLAPSGRVIEFARIESAEEFHSFDEPGFAKTVYDLAVREVGPNRTLLSGLMRTATTDERARRWFRRYWTFGVGSGAHILVGALLDSARRTAEAETAAGY